MLDGVSLKEHITTSSILKKYNLPSVNQLAAEIKLVEAWKIMNIPNYRLILEDNNPNRLPRQRSVRPTSIKQWKDSANLKCAQESFTIDTSKLWNHLPTNIINAKSIFQSSMILLYKCFFTICIIFFQRSRISLVPLLDTVCPIFNTMFYF